MKKKLTALALALVLMLALASPAAAAGSAINVVINGYTLEWTDAAPFIDANGRTLVPLRPVANELGIQVEWDNDTRTACFYDTEYFGSYYTETSVYFTIGDPDMYAYKDYYDNHGDCYYSESAVVTMDTAPVISAFNNRAYAPLRYLAETFGCVVEWKQATREAVIDSPAYRYYCLLTGGHPGYVSVGFSPTYGDPTDYVVVSNVRVNGKSASFAQFDADTLSSINNGGTGFFDGMYIYSDFSTGSDGYERFVISFDVKLYGEYVGLISTNSITLTWDCQSYGGF